MTIPKDRKYSETHEWYKVEGKTVAIGITQFAADELTDITYVQLPEVGKSIQAGRAFGEIESVKATSDLMSAVAGKVTAINDSLSDHPEQINDDAFAAWLIRVDATDLSGLNSLMDAEAYEKRITPA